MAAEKTRALKESVRNTVELPDLSPWIKATARTANGGRLHRRRMELPIVDLLLSTFPRKLIDESGKVVRDGLIEQVAVFQPEHGSNAA